MKSARASFRYSRTCFLVGAISALSFRTFTAPIKIDKFALQIGSSMLPLGDTQLFENHKNLISPNRKRPWSKLLTPRFPPFLPLLLLLLLSRMSILSRARLRPWLSRQLSRNLSLVQPAIVRYMDEVMPRGPESFPRVCVSAL